MYPGPSLHGHVVHLEDLVDSRPDVPHTHDDVRCFPWAGEWGGGGGVAEMQVDESSGKRRAGWGGGGGGGGRLGAADDRRRADSELETWTATGGDVTKVVH